ncbi:hypothetical protein HG535_0D06170 [Zygotorulaspora mrakii]|uniref:NAD-dependent epimerase/dehydratase domain-containing protein n=2 Tax=Zygotorulaspora mrakii TaxID=42260 RepID=A0A7H9B2M2_ZYGMR|nr:uncharacterized protein HG535_0D06170 [Zygotorulaspora mrakii]QLG72908.1 hypothetical protein HG535_0D06170 [Zygotorulaspora mrakii]
MSVLVTGATGFIALHIVGDLLDQNYKVIGTVRSEAKADKLKRQFGNNPNFVTEIVADIAAPNAFDHVLQKYHKDIKVVLHTASPFHFQSTDYEKDLLNPAVLGTKSILESIKKYGADTVERVVITSSFAAIMDVRTVNDPSTTYTEADWNPDTWEGCQANPMTAYCGSKKFAEKTAWDFLEANKDVLKFKLATVNPVYVFGPQKFDEDVTEHLNTSCEVVNGLLHSSADVPVNNQIRGQYIDVRDVSKAHLLAFQKENTIGKRLGLSVESFVCQDVVDILNEDFPTLKGKLPTGDRKAADAIAFSSFDTSESKKILGFKFRTLRETVDDMTTQILKKEGRL